MAAGDDYQETQPTGDIDVQKDEVPVEDPVDAETADSDEQLGTHTLIVSIVSGD